MFDKVKKKIILGVCYVSSGMLDCIAGLFYNNRAYAIGVVILND